MIATTAPYPVPEQVLTECVSTASRTYGVPEVVIRAILMVEGGKVGTMSRNTNGSYNLVRCSSTPSTSASSTRNTPS